MKDLRDYPKTHYRAWIVLDPYGDPYKHNGIGGFYASRWAAGEVFYERGDAEFILKAKRKSMQELADFNPQFREMAEKIHIQSIMVPRLAGPSEHVSVTRFIEAEAKKTGRYPGGRIGLKRMLEALR